MAAIPAPTLASSREEWPDADFDLPDGIHLDDSSDKEDWDIEFDFGGTGATSVKATTPSASLNPETPAKSSVQPFIIRPPIRRADNDNEDDEESVSTIKAASTIKVAVFQAHATKASSFTIEEDIEDAFDLPSNLTRLSLAPQPLSHRSSKNSFEWGDRDQTTSSQSSDAYSNLGLADIDPSSNSTSSASSISLPETETEDDDEDELEGLVIPSSIFDSGHGARQLSMMLEMKKKAQHSSNHYKAASPDPEEDFEAGLVLDGDVDLSPSRLLSQQQSKRQFNRSTSVPLNKPTGPCSPPLVRAEHAKSAINFPAMSARQLQKQRQSPSPPPACKLSQAFQAKSTFSSAPISNFPLLKHTGLRGQKSHSGLKPPSPTLTRKLTRKASLSCLIETNHAQEMGKASSSKPSLSRAARYEEPTAASRAKTHKNTTSRIYDMRVPPTRPSTPSSNPAALRLTMPTQSRLKSRPSLSSVFSPTSSGSQTTAPTPLTPSNLSKLPPTKPSTPPAPKVLRRPKRLRTYGDGTELDQFADLPTDREKEVKFHVQPKGYGNRIPGATYSSVVKSSEKVPIRTKGKDSSGMSIRSLSPPVANTDMTQPASGMLRRTIARIGTPTSSEVLPKKTKKSNITRRKPTLIRNLNNANAPKGL